VEAQVGRAGTGAVGAHPAPAPQRPRVPLRRGRVGLSLACAVAGAVLLCALLGTAVYELGPFTFTAGVAPALSGELQVALPPLGEVTVPSIWDAPLRLKLTLQGVDLLELGRLAGDLPGHTMPQLYDEYIPEARAVAGLYLARLALLAACGGFLGAFVSGDRRARVLAAGVLVGLLCLGAVLGTARATYRPEALSRPQYEGALKAAPWVLDLLQRSPGRIHALGNDMQLIARNIYRLFGRIGSVEPLTQLRGEQVILCISDIHNNPAAVDLVRELVDTFKVDLIIDGGDMTDFGTPLEAALTGAVGQLGVPYVFCPGNHESPDVLDVLEGLPGVTIMNGEVQDVPGFPGMRIVGVPDPAALSGAPMLPDMEAQLAEARKRAIWINTDGVFLAVAHNPEVARAFVGRVPVVVTGHTHRAELECGEVTTLVNPGSAGGGGVRGLQGGPELPYSVALLHVSRSSGTWRLAAVDEIRIFSLGGRFTIERTLLPSGDEAGRMQENDRPSEK